MSAALRVARWLGALATVAGVARAGGALNLDPGLATIRAEDAAQVIERLASPRYAGRDTPQPGMIEACEWVAGRFADFGLEPLGSEQGAYLRNYPLEVELPAASTALQTTVGAGQETVAATLGDDFVPVRGSAEGRAEGEVVFAGYGIRERKYRWDDYGRIDVRGKVVLVLAREPRADAKDKRFFEGPETTDAATMAEKCKVAAERGAVALLLTGADADEGLVWLRAQYPTLDRRPGPRLALPAAVISTALAERLLGEPPSAARDRIDRARRADSAPLDGARVALTIELETKGVPVPNVVGCYRGADPERAAETVVVGAHLDHIGVDDRGRIHFGADDNAGGVAALLEVAQAFGESRPAVGRTVVFIAFTGEEKGLLGSKAYVRDPGVDAAKMVAMINLDIVSRGRGAAIEATLPPSGNWLEKWIARADRESGAGLKVGKGGQQFFQRSDHYSFHEVGVPSVFFNEGEVNEDYHRWTDTADKTIDRKVERVAKLAFSLAALAADADEGAR